MVAVPTDIPVTTPPEDTSTCELVLLKLPPIVGSASVMLVPTQSDVGPVIGAGLGLTVTPMVARHPSELVNVTVSLPGAMPVTIPEVVPTVEMPGLDVDQRPGSASLRKVVNPTQTEGVPLIGEVKGLTVTE
jgi:hypothetical protein